MTQKVKEKTKESQMIDIKLK